MTLGQFVKQTNNQFSEKYEARAAADAQAPMLVFVREYKSGLTTMHAKDGSGEGVVVDIMDLQRYAAGAGPMSVFCNVLWMGGAVRDQLKRYAGQEAPLPIKLVWATPAGGGMRYVSPEQLDGDWLAYAQRIYDEDRLYVDKVKQAKKVKWEQENPEPAPPGIGNLAPAQAPVAAPVMQAPVAAPPVQQQASVAPPAPVAAPQAPVTAPVMQAPGAAPQPPAAPPQAPGQVGDQDVQALLDQLNA